MLLGYWDGNGFPNLVAGDAASANQGTPGYLVSGDSTPINEMIASTGAAGTGHYGDYSLPIDEETETILDDKSEDPPGDEHIDNSLADFILTSQSVEGLRYGWSYFSPIPGALTDYVNLVDPAYLTSTRNEYGTPAWGDYVSEIDAGRPVLLLVDTDANGVTDHFIIGIGYSDERAGYEGIPMYASYDTWYDTVRWQEYAPMASGQPWGIAGATYFNVFTSAELLPNDDIATPIVISDTPYANTQDITYTSQDIDDPSVPACGLAPGKSTVWYEYMPDQNETLYLDTRGSGYDTFIAVWTGATNNLQAVACNDDIGLVGEEWDTDSELAVQFTAGTTYYIEIGEWDGVYVASLESSGDLKSATDIETMSTLNTLEFHIATFADVSSTYWASPYIEALYANGVTSGCGSGNYCPSGSATRAQMAIFLLRAKHGSSYMPPAASGTFGDVPATHWTASWIEQLANEGITSGCGNGNYCPNNSVTRDQMAVFLVKAFSLTSP